MREAGRRVETLRPAAAIVRAASASAPWVWTHSLMRNMDGDVVCRGAHIRRVAKAGNEDVRSMTLRRAGWPSDLMPPCKSVDIGEPGHDRQQAGRRRYQGLASNAGPEVRRHAPPPFRRALVDRCHWRPDRWGCFALPAQVRPRKPAAADRHPGRDRDFRNRRQLAVEGGQQARSGPRIRHSSGSSSKTSSARSSR